MITLKSRRNRIIVSIGALFFTLVLGIFIGREVLKFEIRQSTFHFFKKLNTDSSTSNPQAAENFDYESVLRIICDPTETKFIQKATEECEKGTKEYLCQQGDREKTVDAIWNYCEFY